MQQDQEADGHNHQPLSLSSQTNDKLPHGFIYGTDIIEVNIGGVLCKYYQAFLPVSQYSLTREARVTIIIFYRFNNVKYLDKR